MQHQSVLRARGCFIQLPISQQTHLHPNPPPSLHIQQHPYNLSLNSMQNIYYYKDCSVNNTPFFQSLAFSDMSPWQSLNLGPITPQTRRKHLIILRLSSDVSYLLNEPIHLPPCLMSMERGEVVGLLGRGGAAAKRVSREPWGGGEEGSQKLFL